MTTLRVLAAAAILAALVWKFGGDAFLDGLRATTPGAVVAALGIGVVTTVVCALRWRLVARRFGLPLSLPTAIADYSGRRAVNAVLPPGVLGDGHRAVSPGARVGAVGRGVRAVVWERGVGQAVLVAVAAAVVLAHPARMGGTALVLVVAAGVVVAVVLLRVLGEDVRALGFGGLAASAGLSLVAVAGCVGLFLVAARGAGVSASVGDLVVLAATALLVMAVPLSVGGWGPREAYLAAAFGLLGHHPADGLRTSVLYGVLALVSATPGFVVLFGRLAVQRRQVRAERGGQVGEDGLTLAGAAQ